MRSDATRLAGLSTLLHGSTHSQQVSRSTVTDKSAIGDRLEAVSCLPREQLDFHAHTCAIECLC